MACINGGFVKLILAIIILFHLEGVLAFRDPVRDEGLVIDEEQLPPPPPVYPWAGVDMDTYVPMDMNVTRIDAIEDDEDMPPGLRHAAVSMMRFFHDAGIVRLAGRELRIEAGLSVDDVEEQDGGGGEVEAEAEEEHDGGEGEVVHQVVHQVVTQSNEPLVSVHVVEVDSESEVDSEESGAQLVEKDDTDEKAGEKTEEEDKRQLEKDDTKNEKDEKEEEKEEEDKKEEENDDSEEPADTGLEDVMKKLGVNDDGENENSSENVDTENEPFEGEEEETESSGKADESEANISDEESVAVEHDASQDGVSDQRDNTEQSRGEEKSEIEESVKNEKEAKKETEKSATDNTESANSEDDNSHSEDDAPIIHRPVPRRIHDVPSGRAQDVEPTISMEDHPERTMAGSWFITGGSGVV